LKKMIGAIILLLGSVFIFVSCFMHDDTGENSELVMVPDMVIQAVNASGTIIIEAGKGLERTYKWNSGSKKIILKPRDARWYGSLGAYSPGGDNNVHAVIEEGQQHFYSEKEAVEWLTWQNPTMHYVYTKEGLVVGWYITRDSSSSMMALGVQVWQLYIQGKKPSNLPGASEHPPRISFRNGAIPQERPIGVFRSNKPKEINGRLYSGKTIDIMAEKNIMPDKVEECIASGKRSKTGIYSDYTCGNFGTNIYETFWVRLDEGRVILIAR
jgi:hypothetical protein